jgi:two-component system sensor histidine kinase DesK
MGGGIARTDWLHLIPLVLLVRGLGVDMIGLALLADALRDLHAARRELARMAVIEERLRLARDLHDLLGHNLSMIALKSELAERLLVQEPARAAHEMAQVQRVARQTLREVREAVAGYRQPTLRTELDGAHQLLEAAGVAYSIEDTTAALPPAIDAVLAWTVREGVTNIIRHSRAHHCTIRVMCGAGTVSAEVINDGDQGKHQDVKLNAAGSGLAGLTERVQACGGEVVAGSLQAPAAGGFRLWVELPVPDHMASEKEQRG